MNNLHWLKCLWWVIFVIFYNFRSFGLRNFILTLSDISCDNDKYYNEKTHSCVDVSNCLDNLKKLVGLKAEDNINKIN